MTETQGKIIGIDFGTKRIGLAISDEDRKIAWELDILSPEGFWQEIESLLLNNEIKQIVIGLPLNMSGQETQKTEEVYEFSAKLAEITNLPIRYMDERLSSQMAETITGGSKNIDSLAAQILLQNYLNKQQN